MKGLAVAVCLLIVAASLAWVSEGAMQQLPWSFHYPANFGNRTFLPENNPTTQAGVYLGRVLFYETRLSAGNKLSCNSCHQQEKAFTDGRRYSVGADGSFTPRNSMSLANLLWSRKLFWDGRAGSLEEQAAIPLTNPHEMGQELAKSAEKLSSTKKYASLFQAAFGDKTITGNRIVRAIAQFERTLISSHSKYDRYLGGSYQPAAEELLGMKLFNTAPDPAKGIRGANCARCHGGVKTYMELFHNNGLDRVAADRGIAALTGLAGDEGRFKVPTLRNIALTAPYMHDGRFNTLRQVVDHYSDSIRDSPALSTILKNGSNEQNGKNLGLTTEEKQAVIAFLNLLTDEEFVRDQAFSNPAIVTNGGRK